MCVISFRSDDDLACNCRVVTENTDFGMQSLSTSVSRQFTINSDRVFHTCTNSKLLTNRVNFKMLILQVRLHRCGCHTNLDECLSCFLWCDCTCRKTSNIRVQAYKRIIIRAHTNIHAHTYLPTYVYTHARTYLHAYTHTNTHTHTRARVRMHARTHTRTHARTHAHTPDCFCAFIVYLSYLSHADMRIWYIIDNLEYVVTSAR